MIRVAIAEDSVLLREGLVRLFEDAGFATVGAFGDADALLADLARDPVGVDVDEPLRLESDGAAPRTAIDPTHELVRASQHRGVGIEARQVELKVGGNPLKGSAEVAPMHRLISASHDLHVLLRHRLRSIPQVQESA